MKHKLEDSERERQVEEQEWTSNTRAPGLCLRLDSFTFSHTRRGTPTDTQDTALRRVAPQLLHPMNCFEAVSFSEQVISCRTASETSHLELSTYRILCIITSRAGWHTVSWAGWTMLAEQWILRYNRTTKKAIAGQVSQYCSIVPHFLCSDHWNR